MLYLTHTFTMQNTYWLTKIHSVLTAIIIILLTLLLNSTTNLFIPNSIVQNILETLLDETNMTYPKLKTNKLPNQPDWLMILTIITQKDLTIVPLNIPIQSDIITQSAPAQIEISYNNLRHDTFYLQ